MFLLNSNEKREIPTKQSMNVEIVEIYFNKYNGAIQKFIEAKSNFEAEKKKQEIEMELCLLWYPEKTQECYLSMVSSLTSKSLFNIATKDLQKILQIFKYILTIFSDKNINDKIKYKENDSVSHKKILTEKQIKMDILEYFRREIDFIQLCFNKVITKKQRLKTEYNNHQEEIKDNSLYIDRAGSKLKESLEEVEKEIDLFKVKLYYSDELYKYILEKML